MIAINLPGGDGGFLIPEEAADLIPELLALIEKEENKNPMIPFRIELDWKNENGDEVPLIVSGEYQPGIPASRKGAPEDWTEETPGLFQIIGICSLSRAPVHDFVFERLCENMEFLKAVGDRIGA